MGSAVSGRATYTQVEKHDEKDGEMISKVFQLMKLTGGRPSKAPIKLEFAYLWFLYQFRKTYLTDNCPKISSVFQTLYQSLGLQDEVAIVSLLVDKVLDNLQRVPSNADLIVKSIELLDEMSAGHVAAKLLIEIPQIQFVLKSQTLDQFAALSRDGDSATLKLRGRLYQTLTGLICFIMDDSLADRFNGFFMPFKVTITRLGELIAVNDSSLHDQEKTKKAIIALARDLCGVFRACTGRQSYARAFDLAYPRCFQIFFRACELWSTDPTVMVPILRLYREICISRTQRMLFSVNVPTGFILFKEVSKMITAYATRLLAVTDVPESHMYTVCYKGLSLVFSILHHVLCGDYVNFGVFLLYQDNCFNDAFNVFIEVTLKVGKEQIMVYPKFMRSFHELFSRMTEDHMTYVGNLDPKVQIYLLQMILDGINNLSTDIVTLACASLDNMLMYMYECYSRLENDWVSGLEMIRRNDNCLELLRMNPPVLRELFSTLANSVLLGECRCTWSMSRPLFCMIMLLEQQYNELKMEIVRSQPSECQGFVTDLLNSLTNNLPRNLHTKTKDSFTANVSSFRQHFSKSSKHLATLNEVQEMLNA